MAEVINVTEAGSALVDVVFLHGLGGDAQKTWTGDGWPGWLGWLGEDLPDVAIWTVGYSADSSRWHRRKAIPIVDRATNLLAALENRSIGQRPVCFVVHSMGGLILKEMLLDSAEGGVNPDLAPATRAVVFLATPHNGSQLAVVADRFRRVYRGSAAIVDLKRDDAHLRRASNRYRQWAAQSRAEHLVFFETANFKGVRVVDEGSSDPGILGVRPIPVDANHSLICKPESRQSLVYGQVRTLLQKVVEGASTGQCSNEPAVPGNGDPDPAGETLPLLRVKAPSAFGRSIEIEAFDRETVSIVVRALGITESPEGESHD